MNKKEIIITCLWTMLVICLIILNYIGNKYILRADDVYKIYMNGDILGYITSENELYSLINSKQSDIKTKYEVKKVYPPENFKIVKTNSYNANISSSEDIYNMLAKDESFTIEGYIITLKKDDETKTINVLDKDIFDKAVHNFVLAFLDDTEYDNFMNDTQPEIDSTGKIIEKMYFDEVITIKKGFISVKNKIFTSESELSQYLLFGSNDKMETYKVAQGDTIESISNANKLNYREFLIANPSYTSKDSLLKIGDDVNITRINPVMTFLYEVHEVADTEIVYEKKVEYDDTKEASYSEITTPGVTGVSRITSKYVVKNGEMQPGVVFIGNPIVITEKVDEVTTKGSIQSNNTGNASGYVEPPIINVSGSYIDTGDTWGWPTNTPYVITSGFEYRWGSLHEGIDISGTGYGSPIYAALDGEVVNAGDGGMVGWQGGWNVVIRHDNGYYTVYAHMIPYSLTVSVGQRVSRGQVIGSMGQSGLAFGTHLHFGLYNGVPYGGGAPLNPLVLWQ